jgi:hypothetical protein
MTGLARTRGTQKDPLFNGAPCPGMLLQNRFARRAMQHIQIIPVAKGQGYAKNNGKKG